MNTMENLSMQSFNWFFEPKNWWFRHGLFWLYRYFESILGGLGILDDIFYEFPDFILVGVLPDIAFVYTLLWFVFPQFLLKKRFTAFIVLSIILTFAYALLTFMISEAIGLNDPELSAITNFVSFDLMDALQMYLLVTGLRLFFEYLNSQKRIAALMASNFESELAFLKSQISPHFLFNTLNNIATLTEVRPEQANETIVSLSNVLRYQLYESEKEVVLLSNEIQNMRSYIDLEKIRLAASSIQFDVEGDPSGRKVAPLLFIPFLENAMKHGVLEDGSVELEIRFTVLTSGLEFYMSNKVADVPPQHEDGGIGMKNIHRRLELLYPNRHNLKINDSPNLYEVQLNLVFE